MNHAEIREKSLLGFWLYIMSDCLLFASLFATYAVLHQNTAGGASAADLFSLPFVFLETVILLTSTFTCGLAMIALYQKQKNHLLAWLLVTFVLGAGFVGLEIQEFMHLMAEGHGYQTSAFLSAFFTLVGTHGLHVTIGLSWMLFLMLRLAQKDITEMTERRLMALAIFWHFLDIVWIFIFSFVYILPVVL